MKKQAILYLVLIYSIITYSQRLSKVYILSEGGFSSGSSKLSLFDVQAGNFTQSIFSPGNLGLYPDGLLYENGNVYVTEQGSYGSSGKIYKLDTLGQVISSKVVGTNPYSLAIANGKIYLTNGTASNVTVLNVSDFSFVKNISVGVFPQEIISFNNKIFVANTSLWGGSSDSTISVIDTQTDSVIAKIIVKKDPASFAISADNFLLVGCPGDANKGIIYKINPLTYSIVDSFSIPVYGFDKDIAVDKNSSNIYFIGYTNDIIKYNTITRNSSVVFSSIYPNNYYYGYNYDYTNKKHYILDAKNFTVNGNLVIIDSANTVMNNFQTGIAPRRVVFKYNNYPSAVKQNNMISNFILNQNYPNPFNPETKICWQTPIEGWSTLVIYDLLGREVARLLDEYQPAGNYSTIFNMHNFGCSIYIYQLTFNDGKTIRKLSNKMTLLK